MQKRIWPPITDRKDGALFTTKRSRPLTWSVVSTVDCLVGRFLEASDLYLGPNSYIDRVLVKCWNIFPTSGSPGTYVPHIACCDAAQIDTTFPRSAINLQITTSWDAATHQTIADLTAKRQSS